MLNNPSSPQKILLTSNVRRLVDALVPGTRLDFYDYPLPMRTEFMDEFAGQGFILSSSGIVGILEICANCDGKAEVDGASCPRCEGYSLLEFYGQEWAPYRN